TQNGPQYVRGMAKEAFEKLLRRNFSGVGKIEIVEFRPDEITVLGEVFHQIHTTMGGGPMRVMDGLASANGFTPLANKRRVKLVRQNAGVITVYELDLRSMMLGQDFAQNLLLEPGDVITVPRNFL
ncbi:MAG: polysaccharide biosynthesis/export family protein, partial [Chthoniobacterales bacterium]